jgi:hypothetical protein
MDTSRALRATSDNLLRDLDVLLSIEEEKRSLEPDDPRLVELAHRVDEIAHRVLGGTGRQRRLTEIAREQIESGAADAPETSIAETPRSLQAILTEWRDAERRAAAAPPGSVDAVEAEALVRRLREEYREAQEASRGES